MRLCPGFRYAGHAATSGNSTQSCIDTRPYFCCFRLTALILKPWFRASSTRSVPWKSHASAFDAGHAALMGTQTRLISVRKNGLSSPSFTSSLQQLLSLAAPCPLALSSWQQRLLASLFLPPPSPNRAAPAVTITKTRGCGYQAPGRLR